MSFMISQSLKFHVHSEGVQNKTRMKASLDIFTTLTAPRTKSIKKGGSGNLILFSLKNQSFLFNLLRFHMLGHFLCKNRTKAVKIPYFWFLVQI